MSFINAGQACVQTLKAGGISSFFHVPGESFLPVLKALDEDESISIVTSRHEGEAGFAALGYAEYSGKPGVMAVSRGPGALNAAIAVHSAKQMSLPLVLLVGQTKSTNIEAGRFDANQYIDPEKVFGSISKKVLKPRTPQEVADAIKEAMELSVNGRPGPVVIELPIDVLNDKADVVIPEVNLVRNTVEPDEALIEEAAQALANAERPLTITGEILNFEALNQKLTARIKHQKLAEDETVYAGFKRFVKSMASAVMTTFRAQDYFDNTDEHYIGNLNIKHYPHITAALQEADVVVAAGHRMTQETTANYCPDLMKGKTLIQIYPDLKAIENLYSETPGPSDLEAGKVIRIQGDVSTVLERIEKRVAAIKKARGTVIDATPWFERFRKLQEEAASLENAVPVAGDLDLGKVVKDVEALGDDVIVVTDAGNNTTWVNRHLSRRNPFTFHAPTDGAMGYGVAASLGIKEALRDEENDKPVVCFVGDGSFLMNGIHGLSTALQQGHKKLILLVCDNAKYGTIAAHQQKAGFDRGVGITLQNPGFSQIAEAFNQIAPCHGTDVERTEDFKGALEKAMQFDGVSVINLKIDPRNVAADMQPLARAM